MSPILHIHLHSSAILMHTDYITHAKPGPPYLELTHLKLPLAAHTHLPQFFKRPAHDLQKHVARLCQVQALGHREVEGIAWHGEDAHARHLDGALHAHRSQTLRRVQEWRCWWLHGFTCIEVR